MWFNLHWYIHIPKVLNPYTTRYNLYPVPQLLIK